MIRYRILPSGALVVGDTETGRTAMAFPNSVYARNARQGWAENVVKAMMVGENANQIVDAAVDARNWKLIEDTL